MTVIKQCMVENVWLLELCPRPRWGSLPGASYSTPPNPLADFRSDSSFKFLYTYTDGEGAIAAPFPRTPPLPRPSALVFGRSGIVSAPYCKILHMPLGSVIGF